MEQKLAQLGDVADKTFDFVIVGELHYGPCTQTFGSCEVSLGGGVGVYRLFSRTWLNSLVAVVRLCPCLAIE